MENGMAATESLLEFMRTEILNSTVRSDLLQPAFYTLSDWCSFSVSNRDLLLRVIPVEELAEYDIPQYPAKVLSSFAKLTRSILGHGPGERPLFTHVLGIFGRILQCPECRCQVAEQLCDSISDALEKFEEEDPVNALTTSCFLDAAVHHVLTLKSCYRGCLRSTLRLVSRCLTLSNLSITCRRLIDQRVLCLMNFSFHENHPETFEHICTSLEVLFSRSLHDLPSALSGDIVQALFSLRRDPRTSIQEGARRVLQLFFDQATYRQIVAFSEENRLASMIELLSSEEEDVNLECLHWIFCLIAATRAHDELKLKSLHERMLKLGVPDHCVYLRENGGGMLRALAGALETFLLTSFENQDTE